MKTLIRIIVWLILIGIVIWVISWVFGQRSTPTPPSETATTTEDTTVESPGSNSGNTLTYSSSTLNFSIEYPAGYTVTEPDGTVRFTIPASEAAGTNLSTDTYLAVERVSGNAACVTKVATSSDAAAGNRYDERVYTIGGSNPCIAVHYLIHYGNIQNYPEGAVKEFNENALLAEFDKIRASLRALK